GEGVGVRAAFGPPPVMPPPPAPPEPPQHGRRRGLLAGCAVWAGLFCTCQVCCRDPYHDPWSGKPREGWCHKCECDDCSDCCDCCDCCDKCSCCGDGCGCDGCGCDCGC
ncbi:hypothetical protein ACSNOK_33050, partial [Streptomyces sp. URMC 126]